MGSSTVASLELQLEHSERERPMEMMILTVPVVLGLGLGVHWVADRVRYRTTCTLRLRQFAIAQA
jgi:hypothetical protein